MLIRTKKRTPHTRWNASEAYAVLNLVGDTQEAVTRARNLGGERAVARHA